MTKKILLQGAMEEEISYFLSVFPSLQTREIGGYKFYQGQDVVVSLTKIGMANAATATAIALSNFDISAVLNQGLAGGHRRDLSVGDVVLGEKAVTIHSLEKPLSNVFESFEKQKFMDFSGAFQSFLPEGNLLSLFDNAEYSQGKKIRGVIGSGDVWNREAQVIDWIVSQRGTHCEEMETQAVYQVASGFGTACLGIRIVSNNELTGEAYAPEVAEILQKFVVSQLENVKNLS